MPADPSEIHDADPSWPPPWVPLDGGGRARLTAELRAELAPGHRLHGRGVEVVARCRVCDHVVVVSDGRWLVVHLTWKHPDRPPWPWVPFGEEPSRAQLFQVTAGDGHDVGHALD